MRAPRDVCSISSRAYPYDTLRRSTPEWHRCRVSSRQGLAASHGGGGITEYRVANEREMAVSLSHTHFYLSKHFIETLLRSTTSPAASPFTVL